MNIIFTKNYPGAIFSYNTALHILNLTNKTPSVIDITVPRNKRFTFKNEKVITSFELNEIFKKDNFDK